MRAHNTADIKNMIQNYTVTSSISKIISNAQLLESVSEFFSTFNAALPIFENPAEIIQKILSNTLPLALLSSIVCIGSSSKDNIPNQTSSVLAQLAHSSLFEIITTSELIQTVLLLQYHELGMYEDSNSWIYNGIATNLINQNSLQLNSNTAFRLKKSVVISDFLHGIMTKKPFQIVESSLSTHEEIQDSLVAFFEDGIVNHSASDYLEKLFKLVILCKKVFISSESITNHHSLLQWLDNHSIKLVPSLNALASGGKILLEETNQNEIKIQDPANILCHLLFFRFLSGIHQINHTLESKACLLYPTSTLDQKSCLATSQDIMAASYRAQNVLLHLMFAKKNEIRGSHVFALCYLSELLIPCAEPLMKIPQYSTGMLLGNRIDHLVQHGARRNPFDLTPLAALFVPALEDNAKIWPTVLPRVKAFKKKIEAAQVGLVFGSAEIGATLRSDVEPLPVQKESFVENPKNDCGLIWGDSTIDGIGCKTVKLGQSKLEGMDGPISRFNFGLTENDTVFCDSLLDFTA